MIAPDKKKPTSDNNEVNPDDGMTKKEKDDARSLAQRRVRLGLILSEIGKQNGIKVEENDKKNALMQEIQRYPGREKEMLDVFKNNPELENQLAGPIYEDKVVDFILELATVSTKEISVEELYKDDEVEDNKNLKKKATNKKEKTNKKTKGVT